MKIRELLQTEIWSKRTSQRILKGFAVTVAGLMIVVAALASWGYASRRWLTQGEREAARRALSLIDSLPVQYSEVDQKDFEVRLRDAEEATEASRQAAWTTRDVLVYIDLSSYLEAVVIDEKALRHYGGWQQRAMDPAKANYLRFISSEVEVRRNMSVNLHSTLDK